MFVALVLFKTRALHARITVKFTPLCELLVGKDNLAHTDTRHPTQDANNVVVFRCRRDLSFLVESEVKDETMLSHS